MASNSIDTEQTYYIETGRAMELLNSFIDYACVGRNLEEVKEVLRKIGMTEEEIRTFGF